MAVISAGEYVLYIIVITIGLPFIFAFGDGWGAAVGGSVIFLDFLIAWRLGKCDLAVQRAAGFDYPTLRFRAVFVIVISWLVLHGLFFAVVARSGLRQ